MFDSSCEGHKGHSLPTHLQPNEENPILTHLLEKCSLISKIRRTLAYVNQFISYLKGNKLKGSIAVEDLQIARKQLFRISQCKLDIGSLNNRIIVCTTSFQFYLHGTRLHGGAMENITRTNYIPNKQSSAVS